MKFSTKDLDDDEKNAKTKDLKTWKNVIKCPHFASLTLVALVAIGILCPIHINNDFSDFFGIENLVFLKQNEQIVSKNSSIPAECNFFSGKWIFDNVSYPLYKEEECSFMGYRFPACQKFGRKDFKYRNWRWQPHHCDIPRFDGTLLLEKLKGKKLMFVGDSVGRNQWESMLCLVKSSLPSSSLESWKLDSKGNLLKFFSIEYNVTIGFYWAPFLVESNVDNPRNHSVYPRTVRIKSVEKHGKHWTDADILVFNNFAWWEEHWVTLLWGSFGSPNAMYKEVETSPRIFEIALNTWSEWLEMQINPNKTKMFFMGHSPYHYGPQATDVFHCQGHKEPILDGKYWPISVNHSMMQIVESTIEKLEQKGVKVEYLNVTQLSGYRIDAHPSIYMDKPVWRHFSDCLHWCLPGVPDVWNQILYYYIMKS